MKYKVIKSRRRTLSLEVRGTSVIVRSPMIMPFFLIDRFVREKTDWINKHIDKNASKSLPKNQIMFGGKLLRLKFKLGPNSVSQNEDELIVSTIDPSSNLRHLKLKHFLANETRKKVGKFLDLHAGTFSEITGTSFRDYKTKWGSCSPDNFLAFNIRLAMAPDDVIHYVVVHELVHIKVKNHSSRFWNAVSEIMPEYKDKRRWLRDNHHLLNYENC